MANDADAGRYIPAEIKRLVLVEAGHCCAIPTCRFSATEFGHIEPFAKVKEHTVDNIIALCPNHHDMYDNKNQIDQKSMRLYKQKLQFLNKRYTKYELRVLSLLAEKRAVVAAGEIQMQGLLKDGLIRNAKTFTEQSLTLNEADGTVVYQDGFVMSFAAELTDKGAEYVRAWKSPTEGTDALL